MESIWIWQFLQAYWHWIALAGVFLFFMNRRGGMSCCNAPKERGAGSSQNAAPSAATAAELKGQLAELQTRRNELAYQLTALETGSASNPPRQARHALEDE